MTLDQFKSIGNKYNLFYDREMLYFKPDTRRTQNIVALYRDDGIAYVYTECVFNSNYEIETNGDSYEVVNVNYFEKYIKEFCTNYKNTLVLIKKINISKDFV